MTEFIVKEKIDKAKLSAIKQMFDSLKIKVEIKNNTARKEGKMSFFDGEGIWRGYDIDGKTLREKAWKRG